MTSIAARKSGVRPCTCLALTFAPFDSSSRTLTSSWIAQCSGVEPRRFFGVHLGALVDGDGGLQMPPTGALSDDEIGLLRAWIDQGAEFRTDILTEAPRLPVDPKVTALIAAVRAGNRTEIRQIAASREAVLGKDEGGSTALHHAAGYGPLANVELLIDKASDQLAGSAVSDLDDRAVIAPAQSILTQVKP